MNRVAIIGAGMLGQQIAHHIKTDQGYEPVGYFDDNVTENPYQNFGPILGKIDTVRNLYSKGAFDQLVIGIGYRHLKYRWHCFEQLYEHVPFLTFIHSSCWVDKSATIRDGCFLMPGSIIDDHVSLGKNILIQIGCSISHHSIIKDNCFFGPRVTVAGCVTVEKDCFIGVGSILIDSINIGPDVQTGGATLVIDNLTDSGLYVGNPARKIK